MGIKHKSKNVVKILYKGKEILKTLHKGDILYQTGLVPAVSYDDVNAMYSLQLPNFSTPWTNALLRLRRSSDDELKYIFANGNGKLSLDSIMRINGDIFSGGAEVLSDWAGLDDVFIAICVGTTPDNIISNKSVGQATNTRQPKFMSAGVILTKGGEPDMKFNASNQTSLDSAIVNPILNSGETFTVFILSYSDSTANQQAIFTTNRVSSPNNRIEAWNDRRPNKLVTRVRASGTNYDSVLLAQQNNSNQRVTAFVVTPTTITTYLDGVFQATTAWAGTFGNNGLRFGAGYNLNNALDGGEQEVILYASNKTSEILTITADIKTRHNIT